MPPKKSNPKSPAKGGKGDAKGPKVDPLEAERTKALQDSGLLEAYEYILQSLCKAGLPEGNVFDFASTKLLKFETKWKAEQKKKAMDY